MSRPSHPPRLYNRNRLQFKIISYLLLGFGHAVAQWLMRYATSQGVAGSRPVEVDDFYQFT
jgi:hypothetical protein